MGNGLHYRVDSTPIAAQLERVFENSRELCFRLGFVVSLPTVLLVTQATAFVCGLYRLGEIYHLQFIVVSKSQVKMTRDPTNCRSLNYHIVFRGGVTGQTRQLRRH